MRYSNSPWGLIAIPGTVLFYFCAYGKVAFVWKATLLGEMVLVTLYMDPSAEDCFPSGTVSGGFSAPGEIKLHMK